MNLYPIGATFYGTMWDLTVRPRRDCRDDLNLLAAPCPRTSVLGGFGPTGWSSASFCQGDTSAKSRDAVLHELRDAKSPFHCQHRHSSLPLLHPKISQSSTENHLALKSQEAKCDPTSPFWMIRCDYNLAGWCFRG